MKCDRHQRRLDWLKKKYGYNSEQYIREEHKQNLVFGMRFCGLEPGGHAPVYQVKILDNRCTNLFMNFGKPLEYKTEIFECTMTEKQIHTYLAFSSYSKLLSCEAVGVADDFDNQDEVNKCVAWHWASRYERKYRQVKMRELQIKKRAQELQRMTQERENEKLSEKEMLKRIAMMLWKAVNGIEPPSNDYLYDLESRCEFFWSPTYKKSEKNFQKLQNWRNAVDDDNHKKEVYQKWKGKRLNAESEKAFWQTFNLDKSVAVM